MSDTKTTWTERAEWLKDKWLEADDFPYGVQSDLIYLVAGMAKRLDELEQEPRSGDFSVFGIGTARAGWLHATERGHYFQDRKDAYDDLFSGELEPGETFWLYETELGAVGGIDGPDPKLARSIVDWRREGQLLRVEPTGDYEGGDPDEPRPSFQYRITAVHSPEAAR